MSRITRSRSRQPENESTKETVNTPAPQLASTPIIEPPAQILQFKGPSRSVNFLTETDLVKALSTLRKSDQKLLFSKRDALRNPTPASSDFNLLHTFNTNPNADALSKAKTATLVFAAATAGTAICISLTGLLLTCAHCIADSAQEFRTTGRRARWLLFASGDPVRAECVAWDPRRDLALLRITTALLPSPIEASATPVAISFPFAQIARQTPRVATRLLCVGHPGSEDFEAAAPGVATGYDVLHVSEGRFRGYAAGQHPEENGEIGALMHDCWTYWGHSGAPLIAKATGEVVGLHSSWDDETGMRRGVGLVALRAFLAEHTVMGPVSE